MSCPARADAAGIEPRNNAHAGCAAEPCSADTACQTNAASINPAFTACSAAAAGVERRPRQN